MNKAKKIVSSVLAGAMALSMVSIGAIAANCTHPSAVLRRTGVATTYTTTHSVPVIVGSTVTQKSCTITHIIYNKSYICASCGSKISDAGTEEVQNHSINHG